MIAWPSCLQEAAIPVRDTVFYWGGNGAFCSACQELLRFLRDRSWICSGSLLARSVASLPSMFNICNLPDKCRAGIVLNSPGCPQEGRTLRVLSQTLLVPQAHWNKSVWNCMGRCRPQEPALTPVADELVSVKLAHSVRFHQHRSARPRRYTSPLTVQVTAAWMKQEADFCKPSSVTLITEGP